MIGEPSNTNLNNNNGPNNSAANVPDDDKIANSSKVEIGHMVSMVSSDSVFVRNEAADTHTQESIAETLAAHGIPVSESANQEPSETAEPEQKEETGDEVTSQQPDVAAVDGESANQEPHETAEPEPKEAGDEVASEQSDGSAMEENAARPPSSVRR